MDDDIPSSHGGIVGKFGELYIKTGQVDKLLGRELNRALELRNSARYKYQVQIREEDAQKIIDLAKKLEDIAEKNL